jgi:RNA polymerase sigma-70 factor (ECF subfamily)
MIEIGIFMNRLIEPVKEKKETKELPLEFIVTELRKVEGEEFDYLCDRLVKQTAALAYKLAYGKLGRRELAEDAVQDAYELVFRKLHQLRDPGAFKAWFCRIVIHCCHKHFESPGEFHEPADPSRAHEATVERATLAQLFRWLPTRDRNVLLLREVMSFSYDEVSQILRVPIGTVRSRLSKARTRALELLKEHGYEH